MHCSKVTERIHILGGGPAGSAAALAALRHGARDTRVRVIEKSRLPRHKVCGEFFSPEIGPELEQLGVWNAFLAAGPARIQRTSLRVGTRTKSSRLGEPAFGLSRYAFDKIMLDAACAAGADLAAEAGEERPMIVATGRHAIPAQKGQRLFGF